jgi:hypothetical protein
MHILYERRYNSTYTENIMNAYCQVNTLLKVASNITQNNTGKVTILFTVNDQANIQNKTIRCQVICEQDRKCMYKLKIEARWPNHFCRTKARHITYFERVSVALVTKRETRAILYCHLWPVWLYHTFHVIS